MANINNFQDFNKIVITYGYLRGSGDLIKKVKNFFYIDHGYFKQSNRTFTSNKTKIIQFDGYFRIVHNNFWHNGLGDKSRDRSDKLNINLKDQTKKGDYIILSEPTLEARKYYKLQNWEEKTIREIKKYTDRKIIRHNRSSKTPLDKLLQNAWAFVSDHSSAGFKAMINGIPAFFTNNTLQNIGSIKNIERPKINHSFYNLAYEQWNIKEIESGEAWEYLTRNNNYI